MAYVIVDSCTKDENCSEACPRGCIHPAKEEDIADSAPQLAFPACHARLFSLLMSFSSGVSPCRLGASAPRPARSCVLQ